MINRLRCVQLEKCVSKNWVKKENWFSKEGGENRIEKKKDRIKKFINLATVF